MKKLFEECNAVLLAARCKYSGPCGHKGCHGHYYVDQRDGAVIHLMVYEDVVYDPKFHIKVWRTDGTHAHEGQNPEEISIFVSARKIAA